MIQITTEQVNQYLGLINDQKPSASTYSASSIDCALALTNKKLALNCSIQSEIHGIG